MGVSGLSTRGLIVAFLFMLVSSVCSARTSVRDDSDSENQEIKQPVKEASTGQDLRKMRRVGIGLQAAGALGFGGGILELNLNPQWSFEAGFGGGEGFQTYELGGKYVLAGDWLMPYMSFGYANWASVGKSGPITRTNPQYLADKLLSADEKAAGQFQKNILYPGIGLQFMQLQGDWAGSSLFAEVTILMDIGNFTAATTGTLGFLYYF